MTSPPAGYIPVAPLEELQQRGVLVVRGRNVPIAVYHHQGTVAAVDNRCPHMGFPLHQGTIKDGILTCHWHQARFDLCSGCTFDLWADDVLPYDTTVVDGTVYVSTRPGIRPGPEYHRGRLLRGMERNIGLVQAKSLLGLLDGGTDFREVIRTIAEFGSRHHDAWGPGMTCLAICANLHPHLSRETAYFALATAVDELAGECASAPVRREREPLGDGRHDPEQLKRWLRQWTRGRHRDGAERTFLAAVEQQAPPAQLADILFTAASDRPYADIGHVLDFANKMFELCDYLGGEYLPRFAPLLMNGLVRARGGEESAHWHHPTDLIGPLREAEAELPRLLGTPRNPAWEAPAGFGDTLLGDDPLAILAALRDALAKGAPPEELAKRIAWAAALRLARFATTNDVRDWFEPRHTFTHANAVHRAVLRSPAPDTVRTIFHAAIAVYHDRFLNVPPAPLPGERKPLDDLPEDAAELRHLLLATLDRRAEIDAAARIAVRYMRLGHPWDALIDTLTYATVREDIDFHPFQVLEAGVRQCAQWHGRPEAEHIVTGIVRSLAAACPTPRGNLQTATIALRLHRNEKVYEEE